MQFEKRSQCGFVHHAGCHREHKIGEFVRLEIWFPIVHQKERNCRIGTHSLVAVDKGVVLAKVKQVGCRHGRDGRVEVFTTEGGLRSCKGRLQPSGITDAG